MFSDNNKLVITLVAIIAILYFLNQDRSSTKNTGKVVEKIDNATAPTTTPAQTPVKVSSELVDQVMTSTPAVEKPEWDKYFSNDIKTSDVESAVGGDVGANFQVSTTTRPTVREANMARLAQENKEKQLKFNANDLLPQETNNDWFQTDFSLAEFNVNQDGLLNTDRYVLGINTVGSSLKNSSFDLRPTVANPKIQVSPWNNSTIEPDYNIKSWC